MSRFKAPCATRLRAASYRLDRLMHAAAKFRRFGRGFPRAQEPITVATADITRAIVHPLELAPMGPARYAALHASFLAARASSGQVVGAIDMTHFVPVGMEALVKLRCCVAHWGAGDSWEQTGIYDLMMEKITLTGHAQSGCRTISDVRARYARLDRIFDEVRRDHALRPTRDLPRQQGAMIDGIEIHLGPAGAPIFGNRGHHRLGMARVLGLASIPANLGFVHEDAIAHLSRYRVPREDRPARAPHPVRSRLAELGCDTLMTSGPILPLLA